MMDLRSNPGSVVDQVAYLNQTIVLKRAGKPKVGIVPLREVLEIQRRRARAKQQAGKMIKEAREKSADVSEREIEVEINQALAELRS